LIAPSTAASETRDGDAGMPVIEGVDTRTGLARTGGKPERYENLLRRFAERHANTSAEIRAALDVDDIVLAQRLAHTLKGVAATMGADAVSAAAQRIEERLKSGEDVGQGISDLAACLAPVIAAIRSVMPQPLLAANGRITSAAECVDRLQALKTLLENDDGEAGEFIVKIGPGLAGVLDDDEMAALSRTIEEYDFPAALITLNGVCRRLSRELA
jgi:two-component system sensor histidine kinase/response regulator